MAAVDSFHYLYGQVARSCQHHLEIVTVVGACYISWKGLRLLYECYHLLQSHDIPKLRRTSLVQRYGEWAVVTGATEGIGKAYAEELARNGFNVILVSHNREKLELLRGTIARTYGVKTSSLEVDFTKGQEVYRPIKEALQHVNVGILVNNAGLSYDYPQCITEVPEDKIWNIINVNIAAATMMVHIVVPGMVQRKKGAIVNVSSGSCYQSPPYLTIYSASKIYLDGFSRELQSELSPMGIFVQSLMPLCVASSSKVIRRLPILMPDPQTYARHAISTLGVSNRTTGYWAHSIQLLAARWVPSWICLPIGRLLDPAYS
ncbi:inactive hydroxysteroid dehydrogenase-like protein 1 [Pelodytes ibericus]